MKISMRWFGPGYDPISLDKLKQVPGLKNVITTLYGKQPGDEWEKHELFSLKKQVEDAGLKIAGIESLNVHDAIKTGSNDRDMYIERYIKNLKLISQADIHLVCYNFMAVFDWTRSDLEKLRPDGSTVMSYEQKQIDKVNPDKIFDLMNSKSQGHLLPGWEPQRMEKIKELLEIYKNIDEERLFANLEYFLKAIMPFCNQFNIKMAIHPDDPAWSVFGLPRIMKNKKDILRIINMVENPNNGITLCSGSLGTNSDNDIPDIIKSIKERIHFAHIRNLKRINNCDFEESAHISSDGSLDMYEIMKALYDIGFDGPMRPDHGRRIWDEKSVPGYGLYDRAIGLSYLCGLWEAIEKSNKRE